MKNLSRTTLNHDKFWKKKNVGLFSELYGFKKWVILFGLFYYV